MKADCPRAFKSCTIKLASRTPGQRGWSEMLGKARTGLREADSWVQPRSSQSSRSWAVEASEWAQPFLGSSCAQRQPPHLWGCSNREEQWLQVGLRAGAWHRCVLGSPFLAILCCHQERQKLCACRSCFRLVMLFLQSDSAQSLCLAFREDLP